jgi:hypothetical protein
MCLAAPLFRQKQTLDKKIEALSPYTQLQLEQHSMTLPPCSAYAYQTGACIPQNVCYSISILESLSQLASSEAAEVTFESCSAHNGCHGTLLFGFEDPWSSAYLGFPILDYCHGSATCKQASLESKLLAAGLRHLGFGSCRAANVKSKLLAAELRKLC